MPAPHREPRADVPDAESYVVGPGKMAQMLRRSRKWAAGVLKRWADEQAAGGPQRVHWGSAPGGHGLTWCTTIGVVHREFGTRDHHLERRLRAVEKDLDAEVARRAALEDRIRHLERLAAARSLRPTVAPRGPTT